MYVIRLANAQGVVTIARVKTFSGINSVNRD